MIDKAGLRRLMLSRLAALSPEQRESHSARIRDEIASSLSPRERATVRGILVFLALPSEPDLVSLYRELKASGILVAIPRVVGSKIIPVEIPSDPAHLRPGPHGILEPADPKTVPASSLSLVLCPGLAFSPSGARLGRGGGHFDRFLAETGLPAWGVAFSSQIVEEIPTESWDQKMQRVVTESGTLSQPSP